MSDISKNPIIPPYWLSMTSIFIQTGFNTFDFCCSYITVYGSGTVLTINTAKKKKRDQILYQQKPKNMIRFLSCPALHPI